MTKAKFTPSPFITANGEIWRSIIVGTEEGRKANRPYGFLVRGANEIRLALVDRSAKQPPNGMFPNGAKVACLWDGEEGQADFTSSVALYWPDDLPQGPQVEDGFIIPGIIREVTDELRAIPVSPYWTHDGEETVQ